MAERTCQHKEMPDRMMVGKTSPKIEHASDRVQETTQQKPHETDGMEFATEMIAEAVKKGLRIGQAEVPLRKCREPERRPKLRTIRDGCRHLWYIWKG